MLATICIVLWMGGLFVPLIGGQAYTFAAVMVPSAVMAPTAVVCLCLMLRLSMVRVEIDMKSRTLVRRGVFRDETIELAEVEQFELVLAWTSKTIIIPQTLWIGTFRMKRRGNEVRVHRALQKDGHGRVLGERLAELIPRDRWTPNLEKNIDAILAARV